MVEVVLKQIGVHKLLPGVRKPQYAGVRSDSVGSWGDRLAPTLEPVLSGEGNVSEEAPSASGDPRLGNERACLKVLRRGVVVEVVYDVVDDFLREDAFHGCGET